MVANKTVDAFKKRVGATEDMECYYDIATKKYVSDPRFTASK
jgi:hypothetical protein